MGDKKYSTLGEWAKDTCDAIREKDGTSEPIAHGDIPERIKAIPTGSDTSGITATAGDVSENVKFLSKDGVLTQGTMPEITGEEVTLTKDSPETTIEAGHHDGTGKVKADYSGLADVSGLSAVPANVRSGKTFIGSAGTKETGSMTEYSGTRVKSVTSNGSTSIPSGYHDGTSTIYVNVSSSNGALGSPDISVNSSTGVITATSKVSTSGYISSSTTKSGTLTQSQADVVIHMDLDSTPNKMGYMCKTSGYITAGTTLHTDASNLDSNLVASNIKSGVSIFGVAGTYSGGSSSGSLTWTEYVANGSEMDSRITSFTISTDSPIDDIKAVVMLGGKAGNSNVVTAWFYSADSGVSTGIIGSSDYTKDNMVTVSGDSLGNITFETSEDYVFYNGYVIYIGT